MADLIANLQAAAGAGGGDKLYIEDVFSNNLWTGTSATLNITNGIDLSGEGGLVWIKARNANRSNFLFDTVRGTLNEINTDSSGAQASLASSLTSFNSNGFTIENAVGVNALGENHFGLTFRKAPKFFDVVSYTGTGVARTISHNLGSVPGCIMVKRTNTTGDWQVYHRANTANPETDYLILNQFSNTTDDDTRWNDTLPTSTVFSVGTATQVNASGGTYVAYLFAHDAGGFGDSGSDNAITCGGYTGNGAAGNEITLGYEPQFLLIKSTSGTASNWVLFNNQSGLARTVTTRTFANVINSEDTTTAGPAPTATGFVSSSTATHYNVSGTTYIYIAIRRGPMKKPTAGTDVYYAELKAQADTQDTSNVPWPPDLYYQYSRNGTDRNYTGGFYDRLRGIGWAGQSASGGGNFQLKSSTTAEETTSFAYAALKNDSKNITMDNGWSVGSYGNYIHSFWRRTPGVFDIVCYTGTGVNRTVSHNLNVIPELMIIKRRNTTNAWAVYAGDNTDYLVLNTDAATADDNTYWNDTSPTSTVFSVGTNNAVNASTSTYVAYLFASLAGVSKVGTYTGNGSSVTVTTGFQPRFVLVKRTDSTGNWIVGDSYRGFVAGNDPYLLFNSSAAEDTDEDWIDVSGTGFTVNETTANANVNTGTYIYLAIA
jgi:hypothetical protein